MERKQPRFPLDYVAEELSPFHVRVSPTIRSQALPRQCSYWIVTRQNSSSVPAPVSRAWLQQVQRSVSPIPRLVAPEIVGRRGSPPLESALASQVSRPAAD